MSHTEWVGCGERRDTTIALVRGRAVTGRVVEESGESMRGARIGLGADDPNPALSDENGVFTIQDLPFPDVPLTVSKDGFEPETVLVPAGATSIEETRLVAR